MTKNELARELADEFELPRRQITELVEALLDRITAVLKSGDKVQLTPFGQFKIRDRAARIAREEGRREEGRSQEGRRQEVRARGEEVDREGRARAQGSTGPQGRARREKEHRREEGRREEERGQEGPPLAEPLTHTRGRPMR
jgi:DNA-binding protein HU-beta